MLSSDTSISYQISGWVWGDLRENRGLFIAQRAGTGYELINGICHVAYMTACSSEIAPYGAQADGSTV